MNDGPGWDNRVPGPPTCLGSSFYTSKWEAVMLPSQGWQWGSGTGRTETS